MRGALLFAALLFTAMLTVAFAGDCKQDTLLASGEVDDSSCRANNYSQICNGHGSCNCGECVCNERANNDEIINGKYCDCTNFLCDRYNGELCSGPTHGTCICDKCVCKPGWGGGGCQCMNSTQDCMNPDTNEECSNNGECKCNQCKCYETEGGRYSGKWCEECPTCRGKCLPYKPCVQCQVFGTGDLDEQQCLDSCTLFNSIQVDVVPDMGVCSFFDENGCRFTFVYDYDVNREPIVRVLKTLECPPKLDNLGLTGLQDTSGGTISCSVVWTTIVAALWYSNSLG